MGQSRAEHNNARTYPRFEKINLIPLNTRLRLNQTRPIRDRTRWGGNPKITRPIIIPGGNGS